jgi:hypothetical protein
MFLRNLLRKTGARKEKFEYCAVICSNCKYVVGYERPRGEDYTELRLLCNDIREKAERYRTPRQKGRFQA